jgi:poly(3-hydroxybutyrate) depolymerase
MNLDRHIEAHRKLFLHLVQGDGDSAQKHREFYDEYLAVMDLAAEFYLQTVDTVFVRHALPKGEMTHRGVRVDPTKINRVALLTVEGENDDISGVGQTEAAHRLCVNIPPERKAHWLQPAVGHYGVFNGSRFRSEIAPRVADFVLSNNAAAARGASRRAPSKIAVAALRTMSAPPMVSAANE